MVTPERDVEPQFQSWPECGHEISAIGDLTFRCTLPKYHEHDGQHEHQNDDGTKWWWVPCLSAM